MRGQQRAAGFIPAVPHDQSRSPAHFVMSQPSPTPETVVRSAQIITLALVAGVVVFAGVAVLVVGALSQPPSGSIISLIGAGLTVMQLGLAFIVPDHMARLGSATQSQLSAEVRPYGAFLTRHIIRLALLEGAAFFNVIAAIIEHHWWSLGIAGLLVGWMLMQFPTRERVEHWIATLERETGG